MWKDGILREEAAPAPTLDFFCPSQGCQAAQNMAFPHFPKKQLECCRKNCYFRCDEGGRLLADHDETHPFLFNLPFLRSAHEILCRRGRAHSNRGELHESCTGFAEIIALNAIVFGLIGSSVRTGALRVRQQGTDRTLFEQHHAAFERGLCVSTRPFRDRRL